LEKPDYHNYFFFPKKRYYYISHSTLCYFGANLFWKIAFSLSII